MTKPKPHRRTKYLFPRVGTTAAKEYFKDFVRLNSLFNWILFMARRMDEVADHAYNVLSETADDPNEKTRLKEQQSSRRKMIDELEANRQVLLEMVLVRHVDNYLNYLSKLLFHIFSQRPETLKSSETVRLDDVLQHDSIDDFVLSVAERQVDKLSYSSFANLSEFFVERFGLTLFADKDVTSIIEAIEIRNISVHNRCIINERFCRRTGTDVSKIGKRKELFIAFLDSVVPVLFEGVKSLDKMVREKLRLKGERFGGLKD